MPRSSPPDVPDAAEEVAEAKAAFHLRMRARGVQDRRVLRAFELVPRHRFVPPRYGELAARDLALPIGCGQTLDEPWIVARMIEALDVRSGHRVLQVGAGTGYATAVLAQLAAEVMALERYQSLANEAQTRLAALDVTNAVVVWGDGLALPGDLAPFDRILVHGLLMDLPESLAVRLADDGILVAARPTGEGQVVARIARSTETFLEDRICSCRLQRIEPGLSSIL